LFFGDREDSLRRATRVHVRAAELAVEDAGVHLALQDGDV
jgi:hypothetical protein